MLLFKPTTVSGQNVGRGALADGTRAVAARPDTFGAVNPAMTGSLPGFHATVWTTSPYGIREIDMTGLSVSTSLMGIGVSPRLRSVAFDAFRHYESSLQLGTKLLDRSSGDYRFGIAVRAQSITDSSGEFATEMFARAGVKISITPQAAFGLVMERSIRSHANRFQSALLGLAVHVDKKTVVYADIYSERAFAPSYRFGGSIVPVPSVLLFAGASTSPDKISGGLLISVRALRVATTMDYHLILGMSTTVEVGFALTGSAGAL